MTARVDHAKSQSIKMGEPPVGSLVVELGDSFLAAEPEVHAGQRAVVLEGVVLVEVI